jgi:hypothetical protein
LPRKREILLIAVSWGIFIDKEGGGGGVPVIPTNNRHQEKLHTIQPNPHGKEPATRDIKAIPKLHALLRAGRCTRTTASQPPIQALPHAQQLRDEKVKQRRDGQREREVVDEDEPEGKGQDGGGGRREVGQAPGQGREEEEEQQEVHERGIGAVVAVLGLFLAAREPRGGGQADRDTLTW